MTNELPELPDFMDGYEWAYKGKGWRPGCAVSFAMWDPRFPSLPVEFSNGNPSGNEHYHYWQYVPSRMKVEPPGYDITLTIDELHAQWCVKYRQAVDLWCAENQQFQIQTDGLLKQIENYKTELARRDAIYAEGVVVLSTEEYLKRCELDREIRAAMEPFVSMAIAALEGLEGVTDTAVVRSVIQVGNFRRIQEAHKNLNIRMQEQPVG